MGVQFKIISDHKARMSVMEPKRGNQTFSDRLTRWVDRLLLFDFEVVHVAGRTLGMAGRLSVKTPHKTTRINNQSRNPVEIMVPGK